MDKKTMMETPTLIQFTYSSAAYLQAGQVFYEQRKLDTRGKFSCYPVAVVDLDTFGLHNVKRISRV